MVRHPLIIAIAACLAATSTWVSAQELEWIYSVRPDDTVAAICDRYTKEPACASKLPAYNKLSLDREPAAGRVLRIPVSWMKLAPVAATVSSVQGQAFHVHDDGTKTALEENQLLRLGDRVVAEQNSLTIKYPDATVIVLQEGSQLELTSVSAYTQKRGLTAEVYLRTGSLRARVPRHDVRTRFRVRTPAAVAAVRGTEFRVDASELGNGKILAREEVLEGVIAVSTDEHADKDIPMGFGLKVQEGAPPPKDLKKLPPAPAWADKQDGPVIVREYPYTLSWSKLPKVTGYRFEMYEDNSNEVMLLAHNTTANSYRLNDVAQGCYRVQLNGIDKEDVHGLNAVRRLRLQDHLHAPDLLFAEGKPVDQSIA
ncbi:hypothetical protein GYB62_02120, partial [bacterium]|nr:hypothetical protein [bacterium]